MNLKDKVIVITGASRGLGKVLAQLFAQEGSRIVLSSRSKKELETVSKHIGGVSFAADVTDEKHVDALAGFVIKKFGRIDIWINDAGVWIPHAPIEMLDFERIHDMMEVNLFGMMYGSKAALIHMKKRHSGTIINIISTSGLSGRPLSAAYCASKFAAAGFTKSLQMEAKPENISVIAVYPSGMKTTFFDEKRPKDYETFMDPTDVAKSIIDNLKKENMEEEIIIKRKI
jgi:short-subunit dehydrogenase